MSASPRCSAIDQQFFRSRSDSNPSINAGGVPAWFVPGEPAADPVQQRDRTRSTIGQGLRYAPRPPRRLLCSTQARNDRPVAALTWDNTPKITNYGCSTRRLTFQIHDHLPASATQAKKPFVARFGSVVAACVEGAPFGVRLPISVRTGLLAGWGSGLSGPRPTPVVALVAALRGGPDSGRVCAAIWSYTTLLNHVVMIGNLSSGAALIREGWRASRPRTR